MINIKELEDYDRWAALIQDLISVGARIEECPENASTYATTKLFLKSEDSLNSDDFELWIIYYSNKIIYCLYNKRKLLMHFSELFEIMSKKYKEVFVFYLDLMNHDNEHKSYERS